MGTGNIRGVSDTRGKVHSSSTDGILEMISTKQRILLASSLCLFLMSGELFAGEKRYITDQLQITLRSGEGNQFKILRSLVSGTHVEVLESNPDTGYSRVAVAPGVEGWVITRYLNTEPSGREQVVALRKELSTVRGDRSKLRSENSDLTQANRDLKKKLGQFDGDNQRLEKEVSTIRSASASALATQDENRTLKRQLDKLQSERDEAVRITDILKDRADREWFMVGAGVILLGMILGLIIPKIRWRRKSSWNSSF